MKKEKGGSFCNSNVAANDDKRFMVHTYGRLERIWLEHRAKARRTSKRTSEIIEYSGGQMNRTDLSVNIQNVRDGDKSYSRPEEGVLSRGSPVTKILIRHGADCVMNSRWLGGAKLFKPARLINSTVDWWEGKKCIVQRFALLFHIPLPMERQVFNPLIRRNNVSIKRLIGRRGILRDGIVHGEQMYRVFTWKYCFRIIKNYLSVYLHAVGEEFLRNGFVTWCGDFVICRKSRKFIGIRNSLFNRE